MRPTTPERWSSLLVVDDSDDQDQLPTAWPLELDGNDDDAAQDVVEPSPLVGNAHDVVEPPPLVDDGNFNFASWSGGRGSHRAYTQDIERPDAHLHDTWLCQSCGERVTHPTDGNDVGGFARDEACRCGTERYGRPWGQRSFNLEEPRSPQYLMQPKDALACANDGTFAEWVAQARAYHHLRAAQANIDAVNEYENFRAPTDIKLWIELGLAARYPNDLAAANSHRGNLAELIRDLVRHDDAVKLGVVLAHVEKLTHIGYDRGVARAIVSSYLPNDVDGSFEDWPLMICATCSHYTCAEQLLIAGSPVDMPFALGSSDIRTRNLLIPRARMLTPGGQFDSLQVATSASRRPSPRSWCPHRT